MFPTPVSGYFQAFHIFFILSQIQAYLNNQEHTVQVYCELEQNKWCGPSGGPKDKDNQPEGRHMILLIVVD